MGLGRVLEGRAKGRRGTLALAVALALCATVGAERALAADADLDGVDDLVDNCPLFFNPGQADSGGLGLAGPDGIGSDCQCGDVDNDGRVQLTDRVRLARAQAILGPPISQKGMSKCRTDGDGICDAGDVLRIREALAGLDTIDSACEPANPPTIQISTPALGSFSTVTTLDVQGTVGQVDPGHVDVTVNGLPASVAGDGTWQVDVPVDPAAIYQRLNAQLTIPSTLSIARTSTTTHFGDGVADGDLSPMAAALRLNDIGLDKVEPSLTELFDIDLETLIPPGEVLFDDFCAIGGPFGSCLARVDVTALQATFAALGLDVDMNAGNPDFAEGDITLDDLFVEVNILGGAFNAINCDAEIRATTTLIEGDYEMAPDAIDPTLTDVSQLGSLAVAFSNFDFNFTSGICDFPLIGDLIQALVGNIEPDIRQGLIDFLNDPDGAGPQDGQIGDAIEVALAELQIAQGIGQGIGIFMEGPLFDIEIDDLGITLDSDLRATSLGVVPGAPDLLASYDVPELFPTVGATTPVGGLDFDVGICISSSGFNQMLKAQVEGGLLFTELTEIALAPGGTPLPLTAGLLGFLVPAFNQLDPFLPMLIRLRPSLAPVVTGNTGPAGELQELAIGHLVVDVVSNDGNPEINYMSVIVDLDTGFDLAFDNVTGGLAPSISEPDPNDIVIDFLRNPLNANEQGVKGSLPTVFAPLLPSLSDALGSLPIPEFLGFALSGVEVSRQGAFMSLFVDLQPAPPGP